MPLTLGAELPKELESAIGIAPAVVVPVIGWAEADLLVCLRAFPPSSPVAIVDGL